jgi:hypothetical protein
MTLIHHGGSVKIFEQSINSFQLVPFAPTQSVVLQAAIGPYSLMHVAELNNPFSDIDSTSNSNEETVPARVIVFDELLFVSRLFLAELMTYRRQIKI